MTPPEAPFAEPWQAQAFAMTVLLHRRGLFDWGEWTRALGAELAETPGRDYYECWLEALEHLLSAKGVAAPGQLAGLARAWKDAAEATPHGEPIVLNRPAV